MNSIVCLLAVLFIFFGCKSHDEQKWRQEAVLNDVNLHLYKKEFKEATAKAASLITTQDPLIKAQALCTLYQTTQDPTYLKDLGSILSQLEESPTLYKLKGQYHYYKNEGDLSEQALKKATELQELLLIEVGSTRSSVDPKVLCMHQMRMELKFLRMLLAQTLAAQGKTEEVKPLLLHKESSKLEKRLEALAHLPNRENKIGLTPLEFERLQTAKELYIIGCQNEFNKKIS